MARRKKKQYPLLKHIAVIDAGAKGKSIAKAPDGKIIFLSNAVPGDRVDVQVFKKRKGYYEGKATTFHQLSDKRVAPQCAHFGTCGGCKWQHMGYSHQLYYKQQEVISNLTRIGHLELPEVNPIVGADQHYWYRNKMEFSFSNNRWLTDAEIQSQEPLENRDALGFHIPGMWDKILDIDTCHLQAEPSNAIRNAVKKFAIENQMPFFNLRNQTGLLRTLMIRTSSTGEIMVLIQFFKDDFDNRKRLLDFIGETFPEITALLYVINPKANDTIYDQTIVCYKGRDHIFEKMADFRFKISAKSFYQTNSEQAYSLYKIIRRFANLKGDECVYDLYTGTGTIAQFVAKQARKVIGIESVADAIAAAKTNAQLNKIDNVSFFVGDMKTIFNNDFIAAHGAPDLIITDPPRDGMHQAVVAQLLRVAPPKIIYVSCNSATQARDLALMKPHYRVTKVQPVDMFPQTFHVENVVLLERQKTLDNAN